MKSTKIWIKDKWYVLVDEQGYVEGPCFEGMLGCVLQVKSTPDDMGDVAIMALKIPRLLADTIEENAYICKLTEDEEAAVRKVIQAGGTVHGLVDAEIFAADSLRKPLATDHSSEADAFAQRGHMVFVSFQRDRKPRLCSVNLTEKGFDIFPESCRTDFQNNVSIQDWKNFLQESSDGRWEFTEPVFSSREAKKSNQSGPLRNALVGRQTKVWYAALPSIVFKWAGGTLQETITKREIGHWTLKDHFSLFGQILEAVRFLHKLGMIHGDIRPANVMWMGEALASKYRLGDYGSYGREWQAVARQEPAGGFTMVGPAIGQRRHTVFYSPERRAGNEFESADTAVITRAKDEHGFTNYVILLGWRSSLLVDGKVHEQTRRLMTEWASGAISAEEDHQPNLDELQKGDRLRLRNYLFEVKRSQQVGNANQKIFLCSGRYAEILHDSLVVYKDTGQIVDGTVLDLSNYVELHQWSAASDLFSVGAVCLYSLFCAGLQNTPRGNEHAGGNPDRLFLEMIEVLESVPCFGFLWDELESFREKIEELYSRDPSSKDAPEIKIVIPPRDGGDVTEAKEQKLGDMALNATNSILRITPRAKILLEAFKFNLAYFLLFMHFVLACLHRKSHMEGDLLTKANSKVGFHTPFAENRIEAPQSEGRAAEKALARLEILGSYLNQPFFKGFTGDKNEIIDYDPRSNFQVRVELNQRIDEINDLRKQIATVSSRNREKSSQIGTLNREISEIRTQVANLTASVKEKSAQIVGLSGHHEKLSAENAILQKEISRLSDESERFKDDITKLNQIPALRIGTLRKALKDLKQKLEQKTASGSAFEPTKNEN